MNHSRFNSCIAAAGLVVCSVINAGAQEISTTQVLHPSLSCDHVIRLIHMHGVNNSVDRSGVHSFAHHSPSGGFQIPDTELGDLEIMQVNQIEHADNACGPRIAVVVHNQSCRKVCDFRVSAVALLGRICSSSPCATVKVAEILPGAALEVQIQLPIEALAMGNRNGQIIGFQRLVVAIDSYDELLETNEANNIKAWNQAEIPVVVPTIVEEISEPVSDIVTETAIAEATAPAQVQQLEDSSGPANTVAPIEESTDALRSAIEKIDANQATEESTGG